MPIFVDDISTSLEIIAEFPEIKAHYGGHGTAVNMSITVSPASGKFLSFDVNDGIVFGRDDDLYLTIEFYCANESQNKSSELCVVFDIKTHFWINVTVQDWDLYFLIKDAILDSVELTKDNVGMKDRDYKRVLQHVLNYAIAGYNYEYYGAISLNETFQLEPVAKEFVSVMVSPYIQNEFLFIGFDAKSNVHPMLHNAHHLAQTLKAQRPQPAQEEEDSFFASLFNTAKKFLSFD
jgi:hypothetical protein